MLDAMSRVAKAAFLPWAPPREDEPAILARLFLVFIIPAIAAVLAIHNWPQWGDYAVIAAFALGIWMCLKTIRW